MTASQTRVPELVGGVDIRSLPLSALEGFVLSRVDGRAPISELVLLTGLPSEQVESIVNRLRELGAVRWKGEPAATATSPRPSGASPSQPASAGRRPNRSVSPPPRRMMSEGGVSQPPPQVPRSGPPAASKAPSARPTSSAGKAEPASRPAPPAAAAPDAGGEPLPYDPRELEEESDLPLERKKQVLDLFYRRNDLDYYELLGIAYDADKKQVKSAYFALSKAFHPDTMFRKNLGSYKAKMEVVFNLLTEAYETLSKKKSREEYDAYLRATKAAKMAERALAMARREASESAAAMNVAVPPPPRVPKEEVAPRTAPTVTPAVSPAPAPPLAPPREASAEARRLAQEVIARRLRGVISQGQPSGGAVSPPPGASMKPAPAAAPASPPATRTDPKELLKRLTRTLKDVGEVTGSNDQVTKHMRASEAAYARGDLQDAAQLMRKALSLAPERLDIKAEHERLSRALSEKLANDYIVQAQFESKQGKWASAALTWSKVCEGKPQDANAHRQAAFALYKVGGDLRSAQRYAQQAVFLAQNDVDARVLLAQIYLTIGLKLNAKRELDAAAKLDPDNEMVKNLLSDLKSS